MKRILALSVLLICLTMISCNPTASESEETSSVSETEEMTEIAETTGKGETHILVDWMDFIRVNGIAYDGGWENREVDKSRIGEKLGEILYTVKSYYENEEELNQADKRDFTASFRPIGSEIFTVKDDEDSIAVLEGGKYYLYSQRLFVDFKVYGGERNALPSPDDNGFGVVVNSFAQLCEVFGGAQNVPDEIKTRYSGKALDDTTLIIVNMVSGWGGTEYGISSVRKVGSDFHIYALQFDSDADGDAAMHYWTFYIEIDKNRGENVVLQTDKCSPLKNDTQLETVSHDEISKFHLFVPGEDYGFYEGTPVTNRYAAEEVARGAYNYVLGDVTVRFNATYNYWLVKHIRTSADGIFDVYTIIRAADGKIISSAEEVAGS